MRAIAGLSEDARNQSVVYVPLGFASTSVVVTLDTETSSTSFMLNVMTCSGADPKNGLVTSLTPLARDWSCLDCRCVILRVIEDSLDSRDDEENMPVYSSPVRVVTVAVSP